MIIDIIVPDNVPKALYRFTDGVVLTDTQNFNNDINYFIKQGVEPHKIILWNARGEIGLWQAVAPDGSAVVFMEGLEFHVRNSEDQRFVADTRGRLQNQRQFYAINTKDYPAVLANIYQRSFGKPLDWNNLQTWTEKMQWIKLYDSTPLKTRLADKYLVRNWVAEKIGDEYLIPLLGVWDKFDDIDFDILPEEFVLKCNHGSGMNIIVRDKKTLNIERTREKINAWLATDHAWVFSVFETHYTDIKRKIIAEKLMKDGERAELISYKFYCFEGIPHYCQVEIDPSTTFSIDFFDMNWNHTNIERFEHLNNAHPEMIEKPKNYDLMKSLAARLCKDFRLVRVDFYEIEGRVYFGEMTFTPGGGIIHFKSEGTDKLWGDLLHLPI